MKTIHYLRHQSGGVLWEYPFAQVPTGQQIEPIERLMAARHGTHHPKDGSEFWLRPIAVQLLEPGDTPAVKLPSSSSTENIAGLGSVSVQAVGHVSNPK